MATPNATGPLSSTLSPLRGAREWRETLAEHPERSEAESKGLSLGGRGPARGSSWHAQLFSLSRGGRGPGRGLAATILPLAVTLLALLLPSQGSAKVRVKELADVQGVRDNELFGYGLVVGLAGTGDTERILFTQQSLAGMLGRLGIRIDPKEVRARNVAAVMVTARLPAFVRPGARVDVSAASLGNATSLAGGVLLITPLTAADGQVYAVAQGAVQVGGYDVSAAGSSVRKNTPTAGRVPAGATIERSVAPSLAGATLVLGLRNPDFTTASRIAAAVSAALGGQGAKALDPASIEVTVPDAFKTDPVGLLAKLEALEVDADGRARVVVSERTGTVVAGERVRIRPVAVSHGGLQVSISLKPLVSQPNAAIGQNAGANARTVVERAATPEATEESRDTVALPATTTVEELARALTLLGASARDLVSILQAMKAAGALDADLEVI
jgi:flagellar P-ring protein FlgI